jgi:flagellar biosynthesis protein FlhF
MITKKIIADSMPQALKMVREQLGDNAIIVNTRMVKIGGMFGLFAKQKYEVTAYSVEKEGTRKEPKFALELKEKSEKYIQNQNNQVLPFDEGESDSSVLYKKPKNLYQFYSQQTAEKEEIVSSPVKQESFSSPINQVEKESPVLDELQHLRKMMMSFMMNDKQSNALPPELVKRMDHLRKQGVNEEVVEFILHRLIKKYETMTGLDDDIIKNEMICIVQEILDKRVLTSNTIDEETRMINVIGPTGVGKTTTIAKLATEQVLKQKRRVAMITSDVYRVAAVEQLKTYAGILNVPIEVVRSAEELKVVLKKLEHYDLIYMDTTGRNYKEIEYRNSINEFLNQSLKSDNYLVLSMTTKFEDMKILLDKFLESSIQKLILTKYDETSSYGSILNIAFHYPYQLAYITNGQSVPEDITTIDAAHLARCLIGEEIENGSSSNAKRLYASIS